MGFTVFAELNTVENCKKINCLASAMRRQFPIFTLFSVACPVYKKNERKGSSLETEPARGCKDKSS